MLDVGCWMLVVGYFREIVIVGRGVVNIIERWHETKILAAELSFEDADSRQAMVGFVFRRDSPEVVPFVSHCLGSAHDLKVQEIRRHDTSVPGR